MSCESKLAVRDGIANINLDDVQGKCHVRVLC